MSYIAPERFEREDIYFFYDVDDAKLRWDHRQAKAYQRFRGEAEFECVGWSYFNKAANEGVEITADEYRQD